MLVLEGLDRTGKTTVGMTLRKILPGWAYRHHTKPPVRAYHYFNWGLAHSQSRVIMDRLHWSDVAYGLVCRRETGLTQHEWRLTELALLAQRATILYMTGNLDAIKGRWSTAEMWDESVIPAVFDLYEALYRVSPIGTDFALASDGTHHQVVYQSRVPVFKATLRQLVTRGGAPTEALLRLAQILEQDAYLAKQFDQPAAGLGFLGPGGFLVLGEAPADGPHTDGSLGPNYPWDRGPAAEWLWRAMDLAGVDWSWGYFTNAQTVGSAAALGMLINRLKPRVVVTLGNEAKVQMAEAEHQVSLTWQHLRHPQWERRFKFSELPRYADDFSEALMEFCKPPSPVRGTFNNETPTT